MIDNKLSLTFVIPGSTLVSSQECEKNPKKNSITHKIVLTYTKGRGKHKKVVNKSLYIKTRKCKTATQHINMSTEAYLHMLNTPTTLKLTKLVRGENGELKRAWDLLSNHEKLMQHLDLLAHDLKAISYEYEILND